MRKPSNTGRLPAFQFYPADWRKDPGVQSLDFETRGIWFEMLCLMHESNERGVLLLNGVPMPDSALCRLLGLDNQNLTTAITKLLTYGVVHKREEDGALYNRRMVKDEALRITRKNCGSLGGNPNLVNQNPTTRVNQKSTPSSSSSSSSSEVVGDDRRNESEKLSSEGKYLEALAARLGETPDRIREMTEPLSLPAGCLDAYLRNRAAEGWVTVRNKPIVSATWYADLERFAASWNAKTATEPEKPRQAIKAPDGWRAIAADLFGRNFDSVEFDALTPDQRADILRHLRDAA